MSLEGHETTSPDFYSALGGQGARNTICCDTKKNAHWHKCTLLKGNRTFRVLPFLCILLCFFVIVKRPKRKHKCFETCKKPIGYLHFCYIAHRLGRNTHLTLALVGWLGGVGWVGWLHA